MRTFPLVVAVALVGAITAVPAVAVDETQPAWNASLCGVYKKDAPTDSAEPTTAVHYDEAEVVEGFIKYDAAKGKEATTANIVIKNLSEAPPSGRTAVSYRMTYGGANPDFTSIVRVVIDASGSAIYEWGHIEPQEASSLTVIEGSTTGKIFPGANGVAQIVIPQEAGAKAGTKLSAFTAEAWVPITPVVPNAVPNPPTRGLGYVHDDLAIGTYTIGACPTATTPAAPRPPTASTPAATTPAPSSDAVKLTGVKLLTKKIAFTKSKGITRTFKFSSRIALKETQLTLFAGKKAIATAKGVNLKVGRTAIKLKLKAALKKGGKYALNMTGVGTDGVRRSGTFKLTIR